MHRRIKRLLLVEPMMKRSGKEHHPRSPIHNWFWPRREFQPGVSDARSRHLNSMHFHCTDHESATPRRRRTHSRSNTGASMLDYTLKLDVMARRLEMITERGRLRWFSKDDKARIEEETLVPGAVVPRSPGDTG
ncbi:hypothetical protein ABMB68_009066 [Bradyrhizobium sp. RT4a]